MPNAPCEANQKATWQLQLVNCVQGIIYSMVSTNNTEVSCPEHVSYTCENSMGTKNIQKKNQDRPCEHQLPYTS